MKQIDRPLLTVSGLCVERSQSFTLRIDKLQYKSGTIICLAGANGSGKTTFVECLVGLLSPEAGRISVRNHDIRPESTYVKRLIGFVPDDDTWIVPELTASEFFELLIKVYKKVGVKTDMNARVRYVSEQLLFTQADSLLSELSHGNKKKVQIIAALLHQPPVIVVDEVRNGLDPIVIKRVETLLVQEARRGAVIVAATHDLWWAERFARQIVFLYDGQVLLSDTKRRVVATFGSLEKSFTHLFRNNAASPKHAKAAA